MLTPDFVCSAEGEVEFKSILYIPKEAPYDLYQVCTCSCASAVLPLLTW